MREIKRTTQFKKDFKNYQKQSYYDKKRFMKIIEMLANDYYLPETLLDHPLKGAWKRF